MDIIYNAIIKCFYFSLFWVKSLACLQYFPSQLGCIKMVDYGTVANFMCIIVCGFCKVKESKKLENNNELALIK